MRGTKGKRRPLDGTLRLTWIGGICCAASGSVLMTMLSCSGPAIQSTLPPRHAILITVDTLRADRIGAYGYAESSTANLDALAAESVRFERAYSHSSKTVPSVASLVTGHLPGKHGIFDNGGRLPTELPTLALRLQADGFDTAAFIGSYALRPSRGFDRGFNYFTTEYGATEKVRSHPENLAGPLTDDAIEWISGRNPDRQLFLWVHYQEPHGAYTPPSFIAPGDRDDGLVLQMNDTNSGKGGIPKYQWLGHGRLSEYEARYDGEISEFDRHLGRLLQALSDLGILDQSVLVLTADHGEAFGEEGIYCGHGEGLGEVLLHVPMLLRLPDKVAAVRGDRVRLIDVSRTFLEVLKIDAKGFQGSSLLNEIGDRPLAAQVHRDGRHWRSYLDGEYEMRQVSGGRPILHGNPELPKESADSIVRQLQVSLRAAAPWPNARDVKMESLSAEEKEALRAMGYIE